jgi:hypothetical protein
MKADEFEEKGASQRQIFAEYSPRVHNRITEDSESIFVGGKKPWA